MTYGSHFVCMLQGKTSGLRSLTHKSTNIVFHADSMDFHIKYVLKNLHVYYDVFHFQFWQLPSMRGELDINLSKTQIELVLNQLKVETLFNRIVRSNRIVRPKDLSVTDLEDWFAGKGNSGYDINSPLMVMMLWMNMDMMKMKIEPKTLEKFSRALQHRGILVCNDYIFEDLILK